MNPRSYPARVRRTHRVGDVSEEDQSTLAGRLTFLSQDRQEGTLRDESGSIPVVFRSSAGEEVGEGDIVELSGQRHGDNFYRDKILRKIQQVLRSYLVPFQRVTGAAGENCQRFFFESFRCASHGELEILH